MKTLIIAAALCFTATAATLNVCASGCTYSTVQAAASASNPGDTIIIAAGYDAGGLTMPGGWHNVTIKSSSIGAYPGNWRIRRGGCPVNELSVEPSNPADPTTCSKNSPTVLARISGNGVYLGDRGLFLTASPGTPALTNAPSGSPTAHGLTVGQQIVVGGRLMSAYYCGAGAPYDGYSMTTPLAPYNGSVTADTSCTVAASGATTRAGFINFRTYSGLTNGSVVYFLGRTLPSPLQLNTPYYVVNFFEGNQTSGGLVATVAEQFQVSARRGGTPIVIPFFNPYGQDFVIEQAPLPVRVGTPLYVTSTPTASTLTASLTPGGPPITWTQMPYTYNGGTFTSGFPANTVNPVHDITFDGIEVMATTDANNYYPFYIAPPGFHSYAGESYNIRILRSWLHGHNAQIDFPTVAANIAANNVEVGWSIVEDTYYTGGDSQCLGFISTGHVNIHDNEFRGCTENIMSGGNTPWFGFGGNTNGITVTRNYVWKPLKAYSGVNARYLSGSTFALMPVTWTQAGSNDCSANYLQALARSVSASANITLNSASFTLSGASGTIAAGMSVVNAAGNAVAGIPLGAVVTSVSGNTVTISAPATANETGETLTFFYAPSYAQQCFWYEAQESPNTSTPPSSPTVARYVWTDTLAASTFTVTGSSTSRVGLIYGLGGTVHMDYNFDGSVTCPTGTAITVTCTFVANPYFPTTSTRLGMACIGFNATYDCQSSGTSFDGGFYYQNRPQWSKNLLESKYGQNWLIEGNVFRHSYNCDGGTFCQGPALQLTLSGNGSTAGEPINWSVATSATVRNNLIKDVAICGGLVGNTFAVNVGAAGFTFEWAGFGSNDGTVVQNNVCMGSGNGEFGIGSGNFFNIQSTANTTVSHNTALDLAGGMYLNGPTNLTFASNILLPFRSACDQDETDCGNPAATTVIGLLGKRAIVPLFGDGAGHGGWWGPVNAAALTGSMTNNLIPNRPGLFYSTNVGANGGSNSFPTGTYLMPWTGSGTAQQPQTIFATWAERDNTQPPNGLNYRNMDLHLASGQASLYPSADSLRPIGADVDEITAFIGGIPAPGIGGQANGLTGSDVENGWPQFYQRVSRNINIGSTSAVLTYLSDGLPCTIKLWPNTSYSGTPTVNTNDTGATVINGMITVPLTGLSAGAFYQGKRLCGNSGAATEADIIGFTTLTATPAVTYQFAPPPGTSSCAIEYGATMALGSSTAPVSVGGGICSLTVPSTTYWRTDYKNSGGSVIATSDIRRTAP